MSAVYLTLAAQRVEAGDVVCGPNKGDLASQTLRFLDGQDNCLLAMTLVWPHGVPACPVALQQNRGSGEGD